MTKAKTEPDAEPNANNLTQAPHFEAALEELESLVAKMESGDLSLDESLKAFERGVALTRQCSTALKEAELKVQTLTQEGDLVDFESGEIDDT